MARTPAATAQPASDPAPLDPGADVVIASLPAFPAAGPAAATAPLEPPETPAESPVPAVPTVTSVGAGAELAKNGSLILDSATGEAPDTEGLFVKATPIGSIVISTKRLLKETHFGYHPRPTLVLLVAQGAEIEQWAADAITAQIVANQG